MPSIEEKPQQKLPKFGFHTHTTALWSVKQSGFSLFAPETGLQSMQRPSDPEYESIYTVKLRNYNGSQFSPKRQQFFLVRHT